VAYLTYTSVNTNVTEQRYCVARNIEFSTLTSCIVVVGKSSSYFNQVVGAHLVLFGADGQPFDMAAANEVIEVFRGCTGRTYVVGNIDFWGGDAYDHMFQNLPDSREVDTGGAEITAAVQNGQARYWANGVLGLA